MTPSPRNVLILSSNTGGGHRSAAVALENSFVSLDPGRVFVRITQVLEEAGLIPRRLGELYNYLLRHHQDWMEYYYGFVNHFKPNESGLVLRSALRYGKQLLSRFTPDVIVSVHPMTHHFYAYLLKKVGLLGRIPLIAVVTDPCYGFWKGWACRDVHRYYVASEDARRQLIDYRVGAEKIQVVGMPVHSNFRPVSEEQRRILRTDLALDPDKFTVFLNAGWIGGGNIPRIYESLAQSDLDIQAIFLAGSNKKLIQEAHELAQISTFPVRVLGYSDEVHKLMNASDIMVSKLGGLTTFEALATRLPIVADVVTPPMPQERETVRFIEKSGAGILLKDPDEIVTVVRSLLASPGYCDMMRQAADASTKPGASDQIAKEVLGIIRS